VKCAKRTFCHTEVFIRFFALILAEKVEQNMKAVDAVSMDTTIQTKDNKKYSLHRKSRMNLDS